MKKLLALFLLLFSVLLLGCTENSILNGKKVNIKSLTAEKYEISELNDKPAKQLKLAKRIIVEDDIEPETDGETNSPAGQYVIIYKTEKDIKFTIKLDNPKGEAIDAIQITCDDPNSMILVDGEYKEIQFDESDSRILNWAQEDPYEKVFYIQTTSMDDVNTIRIIDIKVNGEWQDKELDRDELKIYKMNNDDLKWTFIRNTEDEYAWNFEYTDRISNIIVTFNNEEITLNNNEYKINSNGIVIYSYEYTYDNITLKWRENKEIELLKIEFTPDIEFQVSGAAVQLGFWITAGTDVRKDEVNINFQNNIYKFVLRETGYGYSYMRFPSNQWDYEITKDDYKTTIIFLGGKEYTVEELFSK